MAETKSFDHIVLGSGISGMTIALCLAAAGSKVLVLEKSRVPGGAVQRFRRKGIPLDTGFHFTGGIPGCFGDMLAFTGILDSLTPVPIRMKIHFRHSGRLYELPRGHRAAEDYLAEKFPGDEENIRKYFALERKIIEETPLFDLRKDIADFTSAPGDADSITLSDAMDRFHFQGELRAILEGAVTCHGTPPSEIPLSSHCRVNYGLLNELCRLKGGGESLVKAFLQLAPEKGIELRTNCTVERFGPVGEGGICESAVLTDGSEIRFKNCFMTIHPLEILALLPKEKTRESFRQRILSFEESCGFFTVHLRITGTEDTDFREELTSCLSTADMNAAILASGGANATGIMLSRETAQDGTPCRCVTVFQSVRAEETAQWADSRTGKRPESYYRYKEEKCRKILSSVLEAYPSFEGKTELLDSASMLTFRDYLSPTGSAYGIRQKLGQHNLFGHLPVRNFYVCGQNSMLPGAFGSMLSSVFLFRKFAGEETYFRLLGHAEGKDPK